MATQSGLAMRLDWPGVPLLPGAEAYARKGLSFGGAKRNVGYYGAHVRPAADLPEWVMALLFDPQTSGGLLLLVAEAALSALLQELPAASVIGRARERQPTPLVVV